ncbi:MAG: ABC transporter substrate-binding protein [Boseongicola sp.]|nr:ABC transporter substrate-binding protein [Boseongicola sp.]
MIAVKNAAYLWRPLRRTAKFMIPLALAVSIWAPAALAQETDRVVVALTPPGGETNRFWAATSTWHALGQSLEGLVAHDPVTGEYNGDGLATSWEHNDDFTEWTFNLREGVQFHYGHGEFTAEDVVHSYELHTADASVIPAADQLRGAEVEILDPYTVRFTYEQPRTNFLYLHGGHSIMMIYSKAQFDQEGLEGYDVRFAGTGPYQFVSREPGGVLYERVEDHYSGIVPDFRELELRFVSEPSTKLAMLLADEAHIADISRELMPDALDAGMGTVESTLPSIQTDLVFNGLYCESHDDRCREELPWYNVKIREAINRALNRDEMLEVLFPSGGYSLHARYTMVEGNEGYDPTLEERFEAEYGYDPERVKQLLEEADYPDSFEDPTIPIILTPMAGMPEVALQQEMVYQYLTAVGLQAEIVELDYARVRAMGRERELYMINPGRNAPPRPTEVAFRAFYTNPGGGLQGWEDDWTAAKIETLINTIDPVARDEIAREIQNYLFEQYVDIPLFDGFTQIAINPDYVGGWQFPGVTSAGYSHWHLIEAAR